MFSTRAPSGEIHAQKEDVAPSAVRQIHAHRSGLAQNREERATVPPRQHLRANAQRVIRGMAHAEHPLVAAHRTHAAPHLVGQRLKRQLAVPGRKSAGNRRARPLLALRPEEHIQRFPKTPLQQALVTGKRDGRARARGEAPRNMEAVNRVEKEKGPHAPVQVVARPAKAIERQGLLQQLGERRGAAKRIERTVSNGGIA